MGFFEKLKAGLKKTKDSMMSKIERLLGSFTKIDEELFTPIRTMLEILEAFKENEDKNKKNKIRRKDKFLERRAYRDV